MHRPLTSKVSRSAFTLALGLCLLACAAGAEEPDTKLNALRLEIAEAHNIQREFADGAQYCAQLDGTRMYNRKQKRVVELSDVQSSLQNLVNDRLFNAQKKRPWAAEDAEEGLKLARVQAERDRKNCELIARLPGLLKQLAAFEAQPTK